ncbi:MAG: hypothetical protein NWF04_04110 [Candidatus Bathyarchaeota archaeon]|nr:hypothetical protein [Candidatus Bathyarchaeota archaeon]
MREKGTGAINEQDRGRRQQRRFSGENKKVTPKLNDQQTGPRKSRGKNKDDDTNLPLTEAELAFCLPL